MIQKPNMKFTDAATLSMKNTSPNSYFFPIENQSQIWTMVQLKQGSLWQSWKTNHNLSYRGPIWVIQKPNIKFTILATISMKDASLNDPFF